jgi:hypothetical protein
MAAKQGNQSALKHGGAGALKRITSGAPFGGPAELAQAEVKTDYEAGGAIAMLQEQAERLHAVSRLYFDAFLAAIQAGELDKADSYCARYGWLANSSMRAWAEVRKGEKSKGGKLAEVLEAYQAGADHTQEGENSPQEGQGGEE